MTLGAQPRIGKLLTALGIVERSVAFDSLGLDALFESGSRQADRGWPARCAGDLRRAGRVVSWFGSRDADFVRRLTGLVPNSVIAPSVGVDRPVWEHLLETVASGAGAAPHWREPITVPIAIADEGRRALQRVDWDGRTRIIFVQPGAGGRKKRWPAPGLAAALESVAAPGRTMVIVHRGPADADAVEALRLHLTRPVTLLDEPPLTTLAGALSHVSAYFGNDSGIGHLASALGVRSAVLFTADHLAWRPWAAHVEPLVVSTQTVDAGDLERVTRVLAALVG